MTPSPWVIRRRLLQAVDRHSNIRNMAVVVEMISVLETYPVTKEVLQETRLGKIINDIRKKIKNEDLGKRAKMLLRNWQHLIEPQKSEVLSKGHAISSRSSNGGARVRISTPGARPPAGRTAPESKNKLGFSCSSEVKKLSKTKRRSDENNESLSPVIRSKKTEDPKALNSKRHQHAKSAQTPSRGHQQHRSSHCSPHSPNTSSHEAVVTQSGPPALSPVFVERSGSGFSLQPENVHAQGLQTVNSNSKDLDSQSRLLSRSLATPVQSSYASCRTDRVVCEDDAPVGKTEEKKLQKCKRKCEVANLDGQTAEDRIPDKLKEKTRTCDRETGQSKPSFHKKMCEKEEVKLREPAKPSCSQLLKQSPHFPLGPYQETSKRKLKRSEILQPYSSRMLQSTVPTIMGAQTPGIQASLTQYLKEEEESPKYKIIKKTPEVASDLPARDLPGITREVNRDDLNRFRTQRWAEVNGCYDFMGNWCDWTQCMSLDVHGDNSRLNIQPYVLLD